jgi:hypothetical protein
VLACEPQPARVIEEVVLPLVDEAEGRLLHGDDPRMNIHRLDAKRDHQGSWARARFRKADGAS